MIKNILISLIVGTFAVGISKLSFAQMQAESTPTAEQTVTAEEVKKAEDVGNKICPVSGEKIDEKLKATYEYEGKIYNFCCPMCVEEFKKDPEKYIKKVEEELAVEAKEKTQEKESMPQMPMGMHEGHRH